MTTNTNNESLQTALQEMNLQKEDKVPFDEEKFLSWKPYEVEVEIINIHNEVVAKRTIIVPRERVLEERNRIYTEWKESGREDCRGVLNAAIYRVFKAAKQEYLNGGVRYKNKNKSQSQKPAQTPSYVVKPL